MASELHHITLTTGHDRISPRDEVYDETIAELTPWLAGVCENSPQQMPMPESAAGMNGYYTVVGIPHGGNGLVVTVYGAGEPLVTFGVAQDAIVGADLWCRLIGRFGVAPGVEKPPEPWCGVVTHPALMFDGEAAWWLGDFERCVAWAWIESNKKPLRSV